MCLYHILFIHSSIDRHLVCVCILPFVCNAAMNIGVEYLFWDPAFYSSGYIPRSGIAGSYASSIFILLRNHYTVFHTGVPFYIPTKQFTEFQFLYIFVNTWLLMCFFFFFGSSCLKDVKWSLICSSLIISDVKHFSYSYWPFVYLWRNVYSSHLSIFRLGCLVFVDEF